MKFCSECGNDIVYVKIENDSFKRHLCPVCKYVHYINPKIIVGSLPFIDDFILLCKRDISPSWGKWTIPSGYMEIGESLEDGAKREAFEEANLKYKTIKLYGTYSIPSIGQVLFVYLGRILNSDYHASSETSEVKLFQINQIPWNDIAFPSVEFFLRKYIYDFKNNKNYKFYSNYT